MPFVREGNVYKWRGDHPDEKTFLDKAWESVGVESAPGVESRNGRPPTPAEVKAGLYHSHELVTPEMEKKAEAAQQSHGEGRWSGLHTKKYPDSVKSQLERTLGRGGKER